jgi:hypothetical protein
VVPNKAAILLKPATALLAVNKKCMIYQFLFNCTCFISVLITVIINEFLKYKDLLVIIKTRAMQDKKYQDLLIKIMKKPVCNFRYTLPPRSRPLFLLLQASARFFVCQCSIQTNIIIL